MAYDNKPNLSCKRFEQCGDDYLYLGGHNCVCGTGGTISSNSGYQISGQTIFHARGDSGIPTSLQIGHQSESCGVAATAIGWGAKAFANCSIAIGYNNVICSGNTYTTLIGAQSCTLVGSAYANYVVVPNLAILTQPSAGACTDSVLVWNSSDKLIKKVPYISGGTSGGLVTGATNGLGLSDKKVCLGGTLSAPVVINTNNNNFCICNNGKARQIYIDSGEVRLGFSGASGNGIISIQPNGVSLTSQSVSSVCVASIYLQNGDNTINFNSAGSYIACVHPYGFNVTGAICASGNVCAPNLPAKTTETRIVYVDGNGRFAKGFVSGVTSGIGGIGWSNLTNGSTVAGCGTPASGGTLLYNTLYGVSAGVNLTSGQSNVAIGFSSLSNSQSGDDNIAIGFNSQSLTTIGGSNIALGTRSLGSNRPGVANTAIGTETLFSNTCGNKNVAIGCQALANNISGSSNIAIGATALYQNSCACNNIALGDGTLFSNTNGADNIAMGYRALACNVSGCNNIANGNNALYRNTTGCDNIANGNQALYSNISGNSNIAMGCQALFSNVYGCDNIANGYVALYTNTCGCSNIALGQQALYLNTKGCNNIANGFQALRSNTTGCWNTAIGCCALYSNISGCDNIAIGRAALVGNTTGSQNIANGCGSLYCNTKGTNNIALGFQTLYGNVSGNSNIAMGNAALQCGRIGCNNIALGDFSLFRNTGGTDNIAYGYGALNLNTKGCNNIAIGSCALCNNRTTNNNTAIGSGAGFYASGSTSVFIGYQAGYSETGSSKLHIANSSSCSLICGNFVTKTICIDNCLYVNSITCPSDCRLKSNINSISIAPVNVEYKQYNHCDTPNKLSVGIIAQELCLTHPDLVSTDDKGYLGINYGELHSLEIAYLKCRIYELEKKINDLVK